MTAFEEDLKIWYDSPIRKELIERFESLLLSTQDKDDVKKLLTDLHQVGLNGMTFFDEPASGNHHGNALGGLLKHSLNVFDRFVSFVREQHLELTNETVIKSALLHDLCKWKCYYPNLTLKGEYSAKSKFVFKDPLPLGHGEKSVIVLQDYLTLTDVEKLLIRFHMGPFDEYLKRWNDANLVKICPEYIWLYIADQIVSRIEGGDEE
jgi:hypothetical protein